MKNNVKYFQQCDVKNRYSCREMFLTRLRKNRLTSAVYMIIANKLIYFTLPQKRILECSTCKVLFTLKMTILKTIFEEKIMIHVSCV